MPQNARCCILQKLHLPSVICFIEIWLFWLYATPLQNMLTKIALNSYFSLFLLFVVTMLCYTVHFSLKCIRIALFVYLMLHILSVNVSCKCICIYVNNGVMLVYVNMYTVDVCVYGCVCVIYLSIYQCMQYIHLCVPVYACSRT